MPSRNDFRNFCGLNPLKLTCVLTSGLTEFAYPYGIKDRVFMDVAEPKAIDFSKLRADSWIHPNQTARNHKNLPSGFDILSTLVRSCDIMSVRNAVTALYKVAPSDAINGHFGARELEWISKNWELIPKAFRKWARNKTLVGWADVRNTTIGDKAPCVLVLCCGGDVPYVSTCSLWRGFDRSYVALREKVA